MFLSAFALVLGVILWSRTHSWHAVYDIAMSNTISFVFAIIAWPGKWNRRVSRVAAAVLLLGALAEVIATAYLFPRREAGYLDAFVALAYLVVALTFLRSVARGLVLNLFGES